MYLAVEVNMKGPSRRMIVKVFVEFGHEISYTKSSSHAKFKT